MNGSKTLQFKLNTIIINTSDKKLQLIFTTNLCGNLFRIFNIYIFII